MGTSGFRMKPEGRRPEGFIEATSAHKKVPLYYGKIIPPPLLSPPYSIQFYHTTRRYRVVYTYKYVFLCFLRHILYSANSYIIWKKTSEHTYTAICTHSYHFHSYLPSCLYKKPSISSFEMVVLCRLLFSAVKNWLLIFILDINFPKNLSSYQSPR